MEKVHQLGQQLIDNEKMESIIKACLVRINNLIVDDAELPPPGLMMVALDESGGYHMISMAIEAPNADDMMSELFGYIDKVAAADIMVPYFILGTLANIDHYEDALPEKLRYGFLLRGMAIDGRGLDAFLPLDQAEDGEPTRTDSSPPACLLSNEGLLGYEDAIMQCLVEHYVDQCAKHRGKKDGEEADLRTDGEGDSYAG